jgi:hypothetical protein
MVQKRIAEQTLAKLSHDPFLGAPDGVWAQERRFDLSRRLLNRGSLWHGALVAEEVRARARDVLALFHPGSTLHGSVSLGGTTYSGAELEALLKWLEEATQARVLSHLPEPDVARPESGWIWNFYSAQRLMEFEAEVYGRACEAYDEASSHTFARLGWSLPSAALAPFGVVVELTYGPGWGDDLMPTVTVQRMPMELMPEQASFESQAVWATSRRAVVTQVERESTLEPDRYLLNMNRVRAWLARQNRESLGALGWSSRIADTMGESRPASSVAAGWLWDDLKTLGLGSGTFPQLR